MHRVPVHQQKQMFSYIRGQKLIVASERYSYKPGDIFLSPELMLSEIQFYNLNNADIISSIAVEVCEDQPGKHLHSSIGKIGVITERRIHKPVNKCHPAFKIKCFSIF